MDNILGNYSREIFKNEQTTNFWIYIIKLWRNIDHMTNKATSITIALPMQSIVINCLHISEIIITVKLGNISGPTKLDPSPNISVINNYINVNVWKPSKENRKNKVIENVFNSIN